MSNRTVRVKSNAARTYRAESREARSELPPTSDVQRMKHPFILCQHAEGWDFIDGEWVPVIDELRAIPGVNGVGDRGGAGALVQLVQSRGATLIRPDDNRLGEWVDYIIEYPVAGGGHARVFKDVEFTVTPKGHVLTDTPKGRWLEFRKHLLASHILDPIEPWVIEQKIRVQEDRISRLAKVASTGNALAVENLKVAQKALKGMRASLDKIDEEILAEAAATGNGKVKTGRKGNADAFKGAK